MATLRTGETISHYRVLDKLGEGGMGVVYKAEDTKLRRLVALKFLPPEAAGTRERFLREAQAAAALNHPNICTIYEIDDENGFLAMEFIDGLSVHDKLTVRPLPLEEALDITIQACQGLQAAHEKCVIHRDIKSANLMLTQQGQVKITDFGLAHLGDRTRLTQTGVSLGTPAYMSPEQTRGQTTDRRTDIWSLSVVLYEMVAGRLPFLGDSEQAVSYSILHVEPEPLTALRAGLPIDLDRILGKALAKEPLARYAHVDDLLVDLAAVRKRLRGTSLARTLAGAPSSPRRHVALGALAALALAAATLALPGVRQRLAPARSSPAAVRFAVGPPAASTLAGSIAVSPDGRRIAFVATGTEGGTQLWVRPLDAMRPQPLAGTEGALHPFWSPDGRSLAFFADGKLKRIGAEGGPPQVLADVFDARGGSWNREGVILFAPNVGDRLYRIPDAGGTPTPVTALDPSRQESSHQWPVFLPDGNHFLYLVWSEQADARGVYLASLKWNTRRRLTGADWYVCYARETERRGFLLFLRGTALMAQPFNLASFALDGEPAVVGEGAWVDLTTPGLAAFSASENGVLAYRSGAARSTQFVWVDRAGRVLGTATPPGAYRDPWLSPDARSIAAGKLDPRTGTYDVWLFDLDRGAGSRFSFHPSDEGFPVWSPDGERIVFASGRDGPPNLYEKGAGGAGSETLLLPSEDSEYPTDWPPGGRYIVFAKWDARTKWDLWLLPMFGDRKPIPYLLTEFDAFQAVALPGADGTPRWIAYASNESGRYEIYVQSYPAAPTGRGGKWLISTGGGAQPRWRRDGRELFYLSQDGKLMAVPVRTDAGFSAGVPRALFQARVTGLVDSRNHYFVHPDGQRFLVNMLVHEGDSSPITVVVNWSQTLRR